MVRLGPWTAVKGGDVISVSLVMHNPWWIAARYDNISKVFWRMCRINICTMFSVNVVRSVHAEDISCQS